MRLINILDIMRLALVPTRILTQNRWSIVIKNFRNLLLCSKNETLIEVHVFISIFEHFV